ncbi:MAG: hypothetical protein AB1555_17860 [Nitrospirota bacterium]
MQVILDEERWEIEDGASLMEVLAQVSERTKAKQRIVTGLEIEGRRMTDRDLTPAFLARAAREVGNVRATSQTALEILAGAQASIERFGSLLKTEGRRLVIALREGQGALAPVDTWLGQLADYLEVAEVASHNRSSLAGREALASVLADVMEARAAGDTVRLADLVEYELLPNLDGP